jgi:hypothetical protein
MGRLVLSVPSQLPRSEGVLLPRQGWRSQRDAAPEKGGRWIPSLWTDGRLVHIQISLDASI